jgi:hypothetical protein
MTIKRFVCFLAVLSIAPLAAQEPKPVPKDSVRITVPGCSKGYVFTAARKAEVSPGSTVPEGTHLRLNGSKSLMADIKGQEGSMLEITGVVKKGQIIEDGVGVGGGVRIRPGTGNPSSPTGGSVSSASSGYVTIDVEGWRRIPGECRSR